MPSGKLGTALLTANVDNRVYTVPTSKVASTNITLRNHTPNTAQVSVMATNASLPATEYSTASSVTTAGVWYSDTYNAGNYGYGNFNTEFNQYLYRNNTSGTFTPRWVAPLDRTAITSFTYSNSITTDAANEYPLTAGNNHNNMNSYFQISGFYNDDDYWFAGTSRYLATPTQHPLSRPNWTESGMAGTYTGSSRSYYNIGGIGFRNVYLSAHTNGYVTKTIATSGRTSFTNEDRTTNSDNSFYYVSGGALSYTMPQNWNLSVLPTTRLGKGPGNQFYFVMAGYSSTTQGFGAHLYSKLTNVAGWGGTEAGTPIYWSANWASSTTGARWFRPVGDYVYGYSTNGRVYRRPINAWYNNTTAWDDVTSQFGAAGTMVATWAIVEDRNGIGYWFDTSGNLWHTNLAGDTWYKADQTNRAVLATTITTGLPAVGVNFKYAPINTFGESNKSWMIATQSVNGYSRNYSDMDAAIAAAPGDLLEYNVSLAPGANLSNTGIVLGAGSSIIAYSNTTGIRVQAFGYEE